jgi:hypothetical protein
MRTMLYRVVSASPAAREGDGDWPARTIATARGLQRGDNTTPWTSRNTIRGETAEIGLPRSVSATDRNQPQTPRRPRNEGVRGSNPHVGLGFNQQSTCNCTRASC